MQAMDDELTFLIVVRETPVRASSLFATMHSYRSMSKRLRPETPWVLTVMISFQLGCAAFGFAAALALGLAGAFAFFTTGADFLVVFGLEVEAGFALEDGLAEALLVGLAAVVSAGAGEDIDVLGEKLSSESLRATLFIPAP